MRSTPGPAKNQIVMIVMMLGMLVGLLVMRSSCAHGVDSLFKGLEVGAARDGGGGAR